MTDSIQGAVNKVVGGIMAGKLLEKKRQMALQNVKDIKTAKLKQKAEREKYRAQYEKSKLAKIQAKQKTSELKGKNERITIGGQLVTDPALLAKIKQEAK